MLVRTFWPKWYCDKIDGFWVEATLDEAEAQVFCLLSPENVVKSKRLGEESKWIASELGQPARPYCFLVSRNLKCIEPFNASYPIHHMWNAYSPFGQFAEHHIDSLSELTAIEPQDVEWLGIHSPDDSAEDTIEEALPNQSEVELPGDLQEFIDSSQWTFAKTMPEWPHEYIVRNRVDEGLFVRLVYHIRANGYVGKFYQKSMTYYENHGLLYWTMGAPVEDTTIINRCRIENSYDYRLLNGTLPESMSK